MIFPTSVCASTSTKHCLTIPVVILQIILMGSPIMKTESSYEISTKSLSL
uniref:Uncharacterized protein n=1 Tax=Arion vulgaris TaxID=1028688 RepID=A0A0B7B2M5_9EUPU